MTDTATTSADSVPANVPAEALEICRGVGWELYQARNYPQAEVVARGLVAADPREAYHHSLLAAALQKQGRFAEAIVQVDQGLAANPGHPDLTKLRPELVASADRVAKVFAKAAGSENAETANGDVLLKASTPKEAGAESLDKKTLYMDMLKLVTSYLEGQEQLESEAARKIRI